MGQRWFVSYNSQDQALADRVAGALRTRLPDSQIFFAPASLRAGGYWLPTLAQEIAAADVFLLLVGEKGLGRWQVLEYYEALDRDLNRPDRRLLFLLAEGQPAPGLPFLGQLHWTIAADPASDAAVAKLLDGASGAASGPAELWRHARPYLGLLAMTEADSDYFFGREAETAAALAALADTPESVALLIGNSGVGKSSLAQAGVIAALKRQAWPASDDNARAWPARFGESRRWCFLRMTPGEKPVEELVRQFENEWLYEATDPDAERRRAGWVANLMDGSSSLTGLMSATLNRLAEIGREAPSGFLVYVDQGEELYVRAEANQRRRFSEILVEGGRDPRLSLLMSLRADFTGELHADRALFDAHWRIDVPPVRADTLRLIVEEPARRLGARFDPPNLGADIAARADEESTADAGALTLMSYMLEDMWSDMVRRGDGILRLRADSIELGRVLAHRADAFFDTHRASAREIERIFTLKLASVREDGEPVRRRSRRSEFSDAEWRLVSELADAPNRLIVTAQRGGLETYAEVGHEAIFKRWGRLREWVGSRQNFLVWKTGLEGKRREWSEGGQSDDLLLRGAPLAQGQAWIATHAEDLDKAERDFIAQSGAAEAALRKRADAERAQREALQRRLLRGAFVAVVAVSIVGAAAIWKWREAERQKEEMLKLAEVAEMQKLEAQRQREIAERNFGAAKSAVDGLVFDVAQGLRDVEGMRTETAMLILDRVSGIVDRVARLAPGEPDLQRRRKLMLDETGIALRIQGATAEALSRFRESLRIAEELAARDPENMERRRDLSVSHINIGNVLMDQGRVADALVEFRKDLAIAETLAAKDKSNVAWQRDLSVSYEKVGDALREDGDTSGALDVFQKSIAVRETLIARKSDVRAQRDLSVSHEKIGNILADKNDLPGALLEFRKSLAIREDLTKLDPGNLLWQRDMSVSREKIANVLRDQGDKASAMSEYRKSLTIREMLLVRDPLNTQWRRDISVSHNKIGDILRDQNSNADARDAYQKGLNAIAPLAERDPLNTQWQRDLAISNERIGLMSQKSGDMDGAQRSFQTELDICRRVLQRNPDDIQTRLIAVFALWSLGKLKGGDGRADLEQSLAILKPLAAAEKVDAYRRGWIPMIEADLAKAVARQPGRR